MRNVTVEHICEGCAVREPFAHRCHYDDGTSPCTCSECNAVTCATCGYVVPTTRGALPFGWSIVSGKPYCNDHGHIARLRA